MDSFRVPSAFVRLFLSILYIQTTFSFSSSLLLTELAEAKGIGFQAPLIHWASPESPFYEPNLTPAELMRASVRTSRAKAHHIRQIISINKISDSRKYPVAPVTVLDKAFVMRFNIGTPAVETYAIPDTGSNLIWIQCGNPICPNCFKQKNPFFNPSRSTSHLLRTCGDSDCQKALRELGDFEKNCRTSVDICRYHISYEDNSYSEGSIGSELFTFQGDTPEFGNFSLRMFFGCGYNNSATGNPQDFNPPGIVGLGNKTTSLVGQLTFAQFSYCISTPDVKKRDAKIDFRFGLAASVSGHSTELVENLDGWYIFKNVEGIYTDDTKVQGYPDWVFQFSDGGVGGLMMDTGTTYTELYSSALDALVNNLKDLIELDPDPQDDSNSGYSLCYNSEGLLTSYVPDIVIRFKDNNETYFPFTFQNTWIDNGSDQYCLAMFKSSGMSTIGVYQHRDIKVGYELDRNLITFTELPGCAQS